jgi:hypothetical protein
MDNTTSSYATLPSRSSFHSLPIPAALPRSITPEVPKLTPSHSLPPLSITNLTNPTSVSPNYDSVHKQWVIPGESGPAKRGYSPNGSHAQSQPLKAGMRPDSLQNITSYTTTGFMEADQYPYGDDSDDNSELSHTGTMRYKRANGTTGRKHVPQTHNT